MTRVSLPKRAVEIDLLGPTIVCLAINLLLIVTVVLARNALPPLLPLFYGAPSGEDQLARQGFLVLPLIMVTAISIINILLSRIVSDLFLQRILFGFTVVTTLLSTITVIRIMLLVGHL